MPTPQFEEKMREEWRKSSRVDYILENRNVFDKVDLYSLADWWLSQFRDFRESLVKEVEVMKWEIERLSDSGDIDEHNAAITKIIEIIRGR